MFKLIIIRTLAYLEPQASSKPCWICKISIFRALTYSEQFIQVFSRIWRDIQGYWCIFSCNLGQRRGFSYPFWKSKRCPNLRKKRPDCFNVWVKFSIENIVLKVSRRKMFKIFLCGAFFVVFLTCFWNIYWSAIVPQPLPPQLPWEISLFILQNNPS